MDAHLLCGPLRIEACRTDPTSGTAPAGVEPDCGRFGQTSHDVRPRSSPSRPWACVGDPVKRQVVPFFVAMVRPLPKEAIREGQRARLAGLPRSSNPYDRPIVLTSKNEPEVRAAARLKAAWFSGWDSANAELLATVRAREQKKVES